MNHYDVIVKLVLGHTPRYAVAKYVSHGRWDVVSEWTENRKDAERWRNQMNGLPRIFTVDSPSFSASIVSHSGRSNHHKRGFYSVEME